MVESDLLPMTARRFFATVAASCGVLVLGCGGGEEAAEPGDETSVSPSARFELQEILQKQARTPVSPADGSGRAWIESPAPRPGSGVEVVAGARESFHLVFEVGPAGIARGGSISFRVPRSNWSEPQLAAPEEPGYVALETGSDDIELSPSVAHGRLRLRVTGRPLEPGDRIHLRYGAGKKGARVGQFAAARSQLWFSVDGDGDGVGKMLLDSPALTVRPAEPARVVVTVPSVLRPGETARVTVAILDAFANSGAGVEGEVTFPDPPPGLELPAKVALEADDRGRVHVNAVARVPGVYRLRAAVGSRLARSNRFVVSEEEPRVLWGDLHGHSMFSDATGTPEDYFLYARDVAGLDVVALTDHDHHGPIYLDAHPERWAEIQRTTRHFHEPDRFVTLLGFEWTHWIQGHRHVLYFGDEGPLLSSLDPATDTPRKLWRALDDRQALTFAHHPAGGPVATNWEIPPDPRFEPVTEIVSSHGSSEAEDSPRAVSSPVEGNFVRDALDRGYRLGFIGSGDTHNGHPGLARIGARSGGLAGIVTETRTREGVLEALRNRRVYATSGPRILLRASLGGQPMGATVEAQGEGSRETLSVRVTAQAPLARVDVVRSGAVVDSVPGEGRLDLELSRELRDLARGEYVYVRAIQKDEGAAWSSPFFLE